MTEQEAPQEQAPLNIYVAGGTSLMGRELVRQLKANGHSITVLVATSAEANALRSDGALPVYGDPTDVSVVKHNLKLAEVNTVINLLPQQLNTVPFVRRNWDELTIQLNAENNALLEAAKATGISFVVHTSFAYLYADSPEALEETAPNRSPEGIELFASAIAAEKTVLEMGGCVLRVGYLYSDAADDALHEVEALIKRGMPLFGGKANNLANWLRAEDLVPAVVTATEKQPAGKTFNIVSDTQISAHTFLATFAGKLGLSLPLAIPAFAVTTVYGKTHAAILNTSVALKNDLAKRELDWQPKYTDVNASVDDVLLTWRAEATV